MPIHDFRSDFGSVIRRHFGHGSGGPSLSGLDDLSQEGSPELLSDVMTKLIKDSNSSFIIGSALGEDETAAAAAPPTGGKQPPLDLHTLWKLLEKMDMEKGGGGGGGEGAGVGISAVGSDTDSLDSRSGGGGGKMSTWELVVLQAVLLSLLILVSLLWAFCCKKRCLTDRSTLMGEVVAFARKISGGSSKSDLPPSYSKTDLTDLGLTIDDHLNPPPTYDRAAALNMMELERKSGVTTVRAYSTPLTSSHASLASTNIDHIVDIENHAVAASTSASATTPSSTSSGSRKSSGNGNRVTFSPGLISGPTQKRTTSLPLVSVLVHPESRKRSTQSEGGEPITSVCEIVAHNLNSQVRCQPMI